MFRSQHLLGFVLLWPLVVSVAGAQSNSKKQSRVFITTSLVLAPWNALLSVVEVGPTATTYLIDNHNPSRNNSNTIACHREAFDKGTLVAGPSTAAVTFYYTECGMNPAGVFSFNCPLTTTDTATCTYSGWSGNQTAAALSTLNSSEASPQPCIITAGLEKLAAATATPTPTTSSGNEQASQTATPPTAPSSTGPLATSSPAPTSASFCNRVSLSNILIAATVISLCVVAGL